MNSTTGNCSSTSILRYLNDDLESSEQVDFLKHLDVCADCRRQIEEAAGDIQEWQTVATALQAAPDQHIREHSTLPPTNVFPPGSSATSQHLELAWISVWLGQASAPNAMGKIGMFDAMRVIGMGSSGVVFLALEPSLGREVAIKVLSPHLAKISVCRQRFEREARATAGLVHENIIPIYQVSEWQGLPFLVMQYFPESSLQELLRKSGKLEVELALRLALDIARGLEQSHRCGIIHRDIKPANILMSNDGQRAVLTDFGLARSKDDLQLSYSGILAGTPHFMSPEQARGEDVDIRSDIYNLGCVLFTMMVGKPPLHSESESSVIRRLASGRLPSLKEADPDAPDWLVDFVDCLLSPDAADRPASTAEVVKWLSQSIAHSREPNLQPQPTSVLTRIQSPESHRRHGLLRKMALPAIAIISTIVLLSQAHRLDWRHKTDPEISRKVAEYYAQNRNLSFCSNSDESTYELVEVRVVRLNGTVETEQSYQPLLNVVVAGKAVPPGVFYFVLPVDRQYNVKSIWRQKDNHLIDAPIVEENDTLTWNHTRKDRVTITPPDQRQER